MENVKELYYNTIVNCFNPGDPFLNCLDTENLIQIFDEKMKLFLPKIHCELKNEKDAVIHEALSFYMIHELIEGLFNELSNPDYIISEEELDRIKSLNENILRNKKVKAHVDVSEDPIGEIQNRFSVFFNTVSCKICNNIFDKYELLFMILGSSSAEKTEGEFKLLLSKEQNRRRTFPIEFMKKIKEISELHKQDIPKPSQIDCILLANKELHTYNQDLLIKDGQPTTFLISIRDSYKSQKKLL